MRHLLIDGNNIMFAAQMANDNKLTAGDQETTAIFGTLNSIRKLLEPKNFAGYRPMILWDSPMKTWRHIEYPEYKGNRAKDPKTVVAKEAVKTQRPLLQQFTSALGIASIEAEAFEADDLAGALARTLSAKPDNMLALITSDQDWLQLVNENCAWFDPKVESQRLVTHATFELQTGYRDTASFLFGKALQGDTSDNFPGVGGVGKGTAPQLTYYFKTPAELFAGWDELSLEIKPGHELSRARKKIAALVRGVDEKGVANDGKALLDRNLRMMDLRSVNVPRDKIKVTRGVRDNDAFIHLCKRFGMGSILRDMAGWLAPFDKSE